MIHYEGVSKTYRHGEIIVLDQIDFKVEVGEFVYLMGPSGVGKTTLLKLLIREEVPSQGRIWYNEENIVTLPERKIPALRRHIGMVFQDFKLLEQQTVEENIRFALEVTGKKIKEIQEIVPFLLEKVGLVNRAKAFPKQLSTGEQQRVAIARALSHEPEVLLADEPTGNLDTENALQILELLKQINSWGTTVIMATHDDTLLHRAHSRKVKIKDGKLEEVS